MYSFARSTFAMKPSRVLFDANARSACDVRAVSYGSFDSGRDSRLTSSSIFTRRLPVRRLDIAIEPRVADDFDLVLQVVEDEQRIDEQEDRLGKALRVGIGHGQLFVVARALVRHVADGAAVEARQALDGDGVKRRSSSSICSRGRHSSRSARRSRRCGARDTAPCR